MTLILRKSSLLQLESETPLNEFLIRFEVQSTLSWVQLSKSFIFVATRNFYQQQTDDEPFSSFRNLLPVEISGGNKNTILEKLWVWSLFLHPRTLSKVKNPCFRSQMKFRSSGKISANVRNQRKSSNLSKFLFEVGVKAIEVVGSNRGAKTFFINQTFQNLYFCCRQKFLRPW